MHPGGPRILDVVGDRLGLPPERSTPRGPPARSGNCSSATVLLVLDELRTCPPPPATCRAMAFGPGLTLYAALLRATS